MFRVFLRNTYSATEEFVAVKEHLARVLCHADAYDWQLGRASWHRYHYILKHVAKTYGVSLTQAAGTFSALSPNNDYLGNIRDTVTVLRAVRNGHALETVTVSTYHSNKRKAWRLAQGEDPLSLLRGQKTRNFYLNLIDPLDPVPVTIDGHIYNAWTGERRSLVSAATRFKPSLYEAIAQDVRLLAQERQVLPNVIQAVIWFTWKRLHRIKYEEQLALWDRDFFAAGLGFSTMEGL